MMSTLIRILVANAEILAEVDANRIKRLKAKFRVDHDSHATGKDKGTPLVMK